MSTSLALTISRSLLGGNRGTWAFAAAMTRGDVVVRNAHPEHIEIALDKLQTAGARVEGVADGFRVVQDARPLAVDAVTLPYPGLATDLQPLVMALNSVADGAAMIMSVAPAEETAATPA